MVKKTLILSFVSTASLTLVSAQTALADASTETWGLLFSGDYIQVGVNEYGTQQ